MNDNYTRVNTSNFDDQLDEEATNVQAALDQLNKHDHAAQIHGHTSKATPVDADEMSLWDSVTSTLQKLTWANLKATLKTYFDTIYTTAAAVVAYVAANYAPIAKGVTNGDAHDHNGGDGGTIAYGSLSGTPTITNPPATTAANDFQVGDGAGAWIKKTLAEIKTILGLGSAAFTASTDYATAAKGVTNGDTHDHSGGDGAQVDHGGLGGLADDDHPQYTKHSLATAVSDFLVASGSGTFVKKTLAEVKTLLGLSNTNSGDVTLAGTPSYLTLAAQVITLALINLTSHVTGVLPVANGGTGTSNGDVPVGGLLTLGFESLTIASDTITITKSYVVVDTEGAAATDNLSTINGGAVGVLLILRTANNARDVTVKSTGNINVPVDRVLSALTDKLVLLFNGSKWDEIAYADNA